MKGGWAVSYSDIPEESFIKPRMQQKNLSQNEVQKINKIREWFQAYSRWREYKSLLMFWQTKHFNRIMIIFHQTSKSTDVMMSWNPRRIFKYISKIRSELLNDIKKHKRTVSF